MADKTELTREELEAAYPEIVQGIAKDAFDRGHGEGFAKGKSEGIAAGTEAERERIKAIRALGVAGHEELMETMLWDGKTTAAEAALKILAAEKGVREAKAKAFKSEAAATVKNPPTDTAENGGKTKEEKKGFEALVKEYQVEKKCSKAEAVRAVVKEHPEEHEEYLAQLNVKK